MSRLRAGYYRNNKLPVMKTTEMEVIFRVRFKNTSPLKQN